MSMADFFGTDQDSLNKQFEVDSKTVCDALNAVVRELPSSVLRVFVIRQVSRDRYKSFYHVILILGEL
jgi:hypothetical protein